MEINSYLDKMKNIHKRILEFIEKEGNSEKDYQIMIDFLNNLKPKLNRNELKELLHLITKISNNHHRNTYFFDKIERILTFYKIEMKKNFTNQEIYDIFKSNKRLIYSLIKSRIITPYKRIGQSMTKAKRSSSSYLYFFYPETDPFYHKKLKQKIEWEKGKVEELNKLIKYNPQIFEEKRKIGENDAEICQLIRNDSLDEFIMHINDRKVPLSSVIKPSIFETNLFLIKNKPTLIEYAAFFGSIQIFNYLIENNVKLTSSLWIYAIHSQNVQLIHLLEENKIQPEDDSYLKCFVEALKCHHNELADYLKTKYLNGKLPEDFNLFEKSIPYYNFAFFNDKFDDQAIFYNLCRYDYITLVNFLLKSKNFNVNEKVGIQNFINLIQFQLFFL